MSSTNDNEDANLVLGFPVSPSGDWYNRAWDAAIRLARVHKMRAETDVCKTHGRNRNAWGCPECVREMRTQLSALKLSWKKVKPSVAGQYWWRMPGNPPEILSTTEMAKLYAVIPIGEEQPFEIAGPIPEPVE